MHALALCFAFILDALAGEPKWLWSRVPHPAVLLGRFIARAERFLNVKAYRKAKGVLLLLSLALLAIALGELIAQLGWGAEVILVAILLAHRSLVAHIQAVSMALRLSVVDGRQAVSKVVGRDTRKMDSAAVARAAIESAAENMSDGVVAPAFWYLIGGLPGILLYKAVNTADSMIGYKSEPFREFGWAAARFDDLMNIIPARLTAVLILLIKGWPTTWGNIKNDARLHASPNAGWPEAAMAYALGVALSGPRSYHGQKRDFPWINPQGRHEVTPEDIEAACTFLWRVWGVLVVMIGGLAWTCRGLMPLL